MPTNSRPLPSRRALLRGGALATATFAIPSALRAELNDRDPVSFGLIADVHIGFVDGAEKRLDAFLAAMKKQAPDGLIQLGDFAYPNKKNQAVVDKLHAAHKQVIHAIGNHELDHRFTRDDAKRSWGIPHYYYKKEIKSITFLVLDGNDRGSPTYATHGGYHSYIGAAQRAWLEKELAAATNPVVIVSHQPLAGQSCIDNSKQILELLAPHKDRILVCVNGHSHVDQHLTIDDIHVLHINSASYFWLGGNVRLATYTDPLFTTLTIDPASGTVTLAEAISDWGSGTPEDAGYFKDGKNKAMRGIVIPRISKREIPGRPHGK